MIAKTTSRIAAAKRGFTLTEIAIVLGIIGVILGAIWVAASAVYNNMRISAANRELLQIVQGVRALYATSSTVDPNGVTLTYIKAGVIPADALDTGIASTAGAAFDPWNGALDIGPAQQNSPDDSFQVTFAGLPSNACISMLTASSGQGRDPGMFAAGVAAQGDTPSATQKTLPLLASVAQGECTTASNSASFWFALRATN
jgi:prepilin-type N-terminal cleavage/methylation domain-containing protein